MLEHYIKLNGYILIFDCSAFHNPLLFYKDSFYNTKIHEIRHISLDFIIFFYFEFVLGAATTMFREVRSKGLVSRPVLTIVTRLTL